MLQKEAPLSRRVRHGGSHHPQRQVQPLALLLLPTLEKMSEYVLNYFQPPFFWKQGLCERRLLHAASCPDLEKGTTEAEYLGACLISSAIAVTLCPNTCTDATCKLVGNHIVQLQGQVLFFFSSVHLAM